MNRLGLFIMRGICIATICVVILTMQSCIDRTGNAVRLIDVSNAKENIQKDSIWNNVTFEALTIGNWDVPTIRDYTISDYCCYILGYNNVFVSINLNNGEILSYMQIKGRAT